MNYKTLIAEAWESTQKERGLIFWFGFIPSTLTTSFGFFYLAYQFMAFKKSHLFDDAEESFMMELFRYIYDFISNNFALAIPLLISLVILAVFYLLYPTLAQGSSVQAIARRRNQQSSGAGVGLKYGLSSFLPLFEYHLIIKTFSVFAILIEIAFALRNLPFELFELLLPVLALILIIGLGLTIFLTFTDFYIIIDDEKIFSAMKKSANLVWMNWRHTLLITMLMIIIGIRIVIQAIMVFIIPMVIMAISAYLTTVILPGLSIVLGLISGFIVLMIAAYLNGIVDIFSYTVWTYSFLELTAEKEISARDLVADSN
jgi:hypothetical protein